MWTFQSLVIALCTTKFDIWKVYVLPIECIIQLFAIIRLHKINWLVLITKMECADCVVQTEALNVCIIQINISL